jgi:hypothetical protein
MAAGTAATAAVMIGGSIISNMAAEDAARGHRRSADDAMKSAMGYINDLDIPDMQKQQIIYNLPELVGEYEPKLEKAVTLGPSALEDITLDPRLEGTQMDALSQLSEVSEGGLTDADIAAMEQARRASEGQAQARQSQVMQQMAQRGQGGSGAELLAALTGGQASADRAQSANLETTQMAMERALDATSRKANLAGNIRSQSYGEQADAKRAKDAIERFNKQMEANVQTRNVGALNAAELRNLEEQQRVADAGTALRNAQLERNANLQQQDFDNRYRKAALASGKQIDQARYHAGNAASAAAGASQLAGGITKGITSIVGGLSKPGDKKTDPTGHGSGTTGME